MKTMKDEQEQYEKLLDNVSSCLMGESMRVVIPTLTTLLANAGVMSGTNYTVLTTFVVDTITNIYKQSDEELSNETFH